MGVCNRSGYLLHVCVCWLRGCSGGVCRMGVKWYTAVGEAAAADWATVTV
jgi:hypothetical protein